MANVQDELEVLRAQLATLTARIYRLEQRAGIPQQAPLGATDDVQEVKIGVPPATIQMASPKPKVKAPRKSGELESTIGKLWLNRIGIFAILVGVSYFIKYAFDSGWIGPAGRIAIGLLAGIAVVMWSERFRKKGYAAFSYSLKAVGIGTLYLSLWGAFQIYHLVPAEVAFSAMILVTASTIVLALTQDAEILAAFAMIGGFSTPVLLSSGENHETALFSYVCLLDLAILAMVRFKPWRRLLVGSFVGTQILFWGWYSSYYTRDQRELTVSFALLFGAIFAVIPLITPLTKSRWHPGPSVTLTFLPLANAAAIFLALFFMYEGDHTGAGFVQDTLTWYALGLAAAYLVLSSLFKRRAGSDPDIVKATNLVHVAIAIAFITIAIPLKLNHHWITIGWLIESAVLLLVAVRTRATFLRYFAVVALALGIFRLLAYDNFYVENLFFNWRFATYLIAIAILGGIVSAGHRFAGPREALALRIAAIALNLLALTALTLEASDYFGRRVADWYQVRVHAGYGPLQQIQFARNFSYSAIWLAYGAGLMIFGFWKRSAFVRWQALALIAFTIGKVFIYDVSQLQQGYRILSFIALGAVLMGISYAYHRDWLKLSSKTRETSAEESSS
jgi:uncharacterized membrane protein